MPLRRLVLLAILAIFTLFITTTALGSYLALVGPFQPWNPFFFLQANLEQERAFLIYNNTGKALYFLHLVERRANDLAALTDSENEAITLYYLDIDLNKASQAMSAAPEKDTKILLDRLDTLTQKVSDTLPVLKYVPGQFPRLFKTVQSKVSTLHQMSVNSATRQK
jgi:hypothetical protein